MCKGGPEVKLFTFPRGNRTLIFFGCLDVMCFPLCSKTHFMWLRGSPVLPHLAEQLACVEWVALWGWNAAVGRCAGWGGLSSRGLHGGNSMLAPKPLVWGLLPSSGLAKPSSCSYFSGGTAWPAQPRGWLEVDVLPQKRSNILYSCCGLCKNFFSLDSLSDLEWNTCFGPLRCQQPL